MSIDRSWDEDLNFNWTDNDNGDHTGDVVWQTIIDETSGYGCARLTCETNGVDDLEVRATIDGRAAITVTPRYNAVQYFYNFQYSKSLKIEVRTSDAGQIIYWDAWWNNY